MKPTYREKILLDYLLGGFRSTLKGLRIIKKSVRFHARFVGTASEYPRYVFLGTGSAQQNMRLAVVAAMMAVAAGFSLPPLTSLPSAPSRTVRLVSGHHRSYVPRGLAVRICGVVRNISQARQFGLQV